VNIVSVARKLSTVEQHQGQSCWFRRETIERKATTPINILGSSSDKDIFCNLEANDDGRMQIIPEMISSAEKILGTKVKTPRKVSWV
jgi:hypothetical protein